ncbi:MAG: TldD/PmbA family protein [Chloroflexi bacterium]|nr:TldD/PmbA family protein [Chloroflexota bacterium]
MQQPIAREEIEAALRGHTADYVEVRIEENAATRIAYRGRDLEDIGRTTNLGGNVRALYRGAWGFVSFNDLSDLRSKVEAAVSQARVAGTERSQLAPVPAVVDVVTPFIQKDPRGVPLADKKRVLDEYNDLIWTTPKIQTSVIGYADTWKSVIFASTEGSYLDQSKVDVTLRVSAVARHDGDVQQAGFSVGRLGDYGFVEQQHQAVQEAANRAVELLSAPAVQGGEYVVVLDPILAGVFCHEAFGHLSESDFVYENPRMREIMVLGKRFGPAILNIVDGAAVPGLRGSFRYDDEGTPTRRSDLIREGVLVGRLHSRETAGKMGEQPTGNARAIDYRFPPIVRMTNTFIEPGTTSFADMIADIQEGVYARNWYGGQTSMEMFTFSAGEAYMIRNGKVAEMLRPVVLTGNVFDTLQRVDAIGNDLDMNQGGGCGKHGQSPLPVSNGSPHIRISRCLVGGR